MNFESDLVVHDSNGEADGSLRRGMDSGVGQQIVDDLAQAQAITEHDRLIGEVIDDRSIRFDDAEVTDRVATDFCQIDSHQFESALLIKPSQQQEFIDQSRHASAFGFDAAHRVGDRWCVVQRALAVKLGVSAEGSEWGAEFVGGIGDELAKSCFAGIADIRGVFDLDEHLVQGATESAEFGVGIDRGVGDSLGEVTLGNRRRGIDHLLDRAQALANDEPDY